MVETYILCGLSYTSTAVQPLGGGNMLVPIQFLSLPEPREVISAFTWLEAGFAE